MCSKKKLPKGIPCFVVHVGGTREVRVVERLYSGVGYYSFGEKNSKGTPRMYKVYPIFIGTPKNEAKLYDRVEYVLVEE